MKTKVNERMSEDYLLTFFATLSRLKVNIAWQIIQLLMMQLIYTSKSTRGF